MLKPILASTLDLDIMLIRLLGCLMVNEFLDTQNNESSLYMELRPAPRLTKAVGEPARAHVYGFKAGTSVRGVVEWYSKY